MCQNIGKRTVEQNVNSNAFSIPINFAVKNMPYIVVDGPM